MGCDPRNDIELKQRMASYSPKTSTQGIDKSSGEDDAGYQFTRDGYGNEAAAVASGSLAVTKGRRRMCEDIYRIVVIIQYRLSESLIFQKSVKQ